MPMGYNSKGEFVTPESIVNKDQPMPTYSIPRRTNMPHPKFQIRQLVAVPDSVCATRLASIMAYEYQPPTHVGEFPSDAERRRENIDCSGYVYTISIHGNQTKFVDEKTLLSWNPSRIQKLNTPSAPLDLET